MSRWHLQAMVHSMRCYVFILVLMATLSLTSAACPDACHCRNLNDGGTAVDCRGRGLTAIVTDIPSDAVELDLGLNPIRNISRSSFNSAASRLRRLIMDGCLLERLERMSFRNLQLLEILDLSGNRIGVVGDGAFQGLQHLRDLNLNRNDIRALPGYLFRGLNLDELQLAGNGLRELSGDLFAAAKIRSLNLDHNAFTHLGRQNFRQIGAHLRILSVSNNSNPLTIDDDAFNEADLTRLSLVSSQLQGVQFLSQTSAMTIDLSKNTLPSIVLIPSDSLARSCRELRLSGVALESLDDSLLSSLQSINHLDLSGNRLTTVKPEMFRFTPDLTLLDLSRNHLSRLPEGFGINLQNLESLNLSRSGVASISWDGIRAMIRLVNLDLSENQLQVIPENSSGILDSIAVLNLSGNPWHCSCEMRWFRQWLAETMRPVGGALRCSSPSSDLMLNLVPGNFICTSPQITFITASKNVQEGTIVLLSCAAQSDPAPSIVWRAPFGDVLSITPPEDRVRTKTIADWAIHRIKPYQSGWYSCNATNVLRSNVTYTYLQVTASPEDELDMDNLAYPMIPSKPTPTSTSTMTTLTTTAATQEKLVLNVSNVIFIESSSRSTPKEGTEMAFTNASRSSTTSELDDIDGPIPPSSSRHDDRTSPVPRSPSSELTSTLILSEAAAADAAPPVSKDLIIILVVTVVGLILVAAVVVAVVVLVYRRKSTRKYPVNPPDCEARDVSETSKLQMSNLDDSGYSSTTTDPLNHTKRRQ